MTARALVKLVLASGALIVTTALMWSDTAISWWSIFVEIGQPWFTELRSRQASDLIGNAIGIVGSFIILESYAYRKGHN